MQKPNGVFLQMDGRERKVNSVGAASGEFDILDVCRYFAGQHPSARQDFPCPTGGSDGAQADRRARNDLGLIIKLGTAGAGGMAGPSGAW